MRRVFGVLVLVAAAVAGLWAWEHHKQAVVIKELNARLDRLKAEELVADVAVLGQEKGSDGTTLTKLSFVEYRPNSNEQLFSKTFEIKGEEFYVDALVVRFDDKFVEIGDGLRGKSLLLFRRAFGNQQKPDDGTPLFNTGPDEKNPVPAGLAIPGAPSEFEKGLWSRFWTLANDPEEAKKVGVRVAQGEAPHILARPHQVYQVRLRATGGLEIRPRLSEALQKEMEKQKPKK
jgi:hypothetical protein